jgi:hypothetical protein
MGRVRMNTSEKNARPINSGDTWRRVLEHATPRKQRFHLLRFVERKGDKKRPGNRHLQSDGRSFTTVALHCRDEARMSRLSRIRMSQRVQFGRGSEKQRQSQTCQHRAQQRESTNTSVAESFGHANEIWS